MTEAAKEKAYLSPGQRALEWWRDTCQPTAAADENSSRRRDPAIRARLRRCDSNTEAAAIPAAILLARRLQSLRNDVRGRDTDINAALGLARVLSFVTEDARERPMKAAGWKHFPGESTKSPSADNTPRLAEARFRRLLAVKPGNEQVIAFSRLVKLLGGSVNVADLSQDFLDWGSDATRQRWAFDYYAASYAAPSPDDTSPSEENA